MDQKIEKSEKHGTEITDGVITLKPFEIEDAEKHLAGEDEEQIEWLSGGEGTLEGVKNWINRNKEYWEKDGPVFNFAIRNNEADELIGMIEANKDFEHVEGLKEGDANISYGLYPHAREKGYMVRAVALVEQFLNEKGIKRAVIRVAPRNEKSLRVPAGCGYLEIGKIKTEKGDELTIFSKDLQQESN